MGGVRILLISLLVVAGAAGISGAAFGQEGPGGLINPGRDCQTLTTCRFTKGGSYRGCVSSYSCRVCKFTPASCQIGPSGKHCQKLRCFWGA